MKELAIENLDPQQSTTVSYQLPGLCDSPLPVQLTATLLPAKNVEGVTETLTANNAVGDLNICSTVQKAREISPAVSREGCGISPSDKLDVGGPNSGMGPKTFSASMDAWYFDHKTKTAPLLVQPRDPVVGWAQQDGASSVVALGVHFDPSALSGIKSASVLKADLTYCEEPYRWTSEKGDPQGKPGCIARFAIATAPLGQAGGFRDSLLGQHDPASRSIDVTRPIREQLNNGPSHGFVLRGAVDSVDGDDESSCVSRISNVFLNVTYTP